VEKAFFELIKRIGRVCRRRVERIPLDRSTGRGDNTGWEAGGRGDKEVLKMKLRKAVGIDDIPMETWRYGIAIKKGLIELLGKAWTKSNLEDWKKNIIVPLYKRGELDREL